MGCDTISYSAFHYLMTKVEKAWKNRRIIIDPGSPGHYRIGKRIKKECLNSGKLLLMLDYDAFDTQHTLEAQQAVINELCDIINLDDSERIRYVDSFNKMYMYCNGKYIGKAKYGLMSGHRCTTFINSVLNSAYIRMCSSNFYDKFFSIHIGDDVLLGVDKYSEVEILLNNLESMGFKLNKFKQSLGYSYAELLRIVFNRDSCRGYSCRTIARLTSGNWETELPVNMHESLCLWVIGGRTLYNRSQSKGLMEVLSFQMSKSTSIKRGECYGILIGRFGINGGFVTGTRGVWYGYDVLMNKTKNEQLQNEEKAWLDSMPHNSTNDYLSKGISSVEREVIENLNLSVKYKMLVSSYGKNEHLQRDKEYYPITLSDLRVKSTYGGVSLQSISSKTDDCGLLLKYPILALLKDELRLENLMFILNLLQIEPTSNIVSQCWGEDGGFNVADAPLSYDVGSRCSAKIRNKMIYVDYPIMV